MRILLAGTQGQLARALVGKARRHAGIELVALGRPQLDLADGSTIARAVERIAPDLVVNAAAYTAVDQAERARDAAFAVNCDGAGALAAAARAQGCPIVHVSTDYVFDGAKAGAYLETDVANPAGVYGRSKLAGEAAVAGANQQHVILRTAWLFSPWGHNFLKTILRLAGERPELRVVADQRGNPTYAPHLADAILAIAARVAEAGGDTRVWGLFHAGASGETTWHGFASAIVAEAAPLGVPHVPVRPITTADYPTPVKRPTNSTLDCAKLEAVFGLRLPSWQQGVKDCIAELAQDRSSR